MSPGDDSAPHLPDARQLLAVNGALGEYFTLPPATGPQWRRFPELLSAQTLAHFVDVTRSAIADSRGCDLDRIPRRLAASSFQLNVAARLLSPLLAAAVCQNSLPVIVPDQLAWRAVGHHPHFGFHQGAVLEAPTAAAAARALSEHALEPFLAPLNGALRASASLPTRVAWGNVASAANGAVTVMSISRPELEAAGRELVHALLETRLLAGTAAVTGGAFRRHSCCLFYQAPRSGLCMDCVLTPSVPSHR